MQAPSAAELLSNAIVLQALEEAWTDSLPGDPVRRHEEGGWIYADVVTGEITVVRAQPGGRAEIDLSDPPPVPGGVVVAKFHTHPNPTAEGWDPGPSPAVERVDATHGVPDLIRADNGVYASGPERRRGGLAGEPGFPACSQPRRRVAPRGGIRDDRNARARSPAPRQR